MIYFACGPLKVTELFSHAVKSSWCCQAFLSVFIWSSFLAFLPCSNSAFYVCVGVLLIVRMNYFHTLFAIFSTEEPDAKKAKEDDGEEDYSLADIAEGSVTSVSVFFSGEVDWHNNPKEHKLY